MTCIQEEEEKEEDDDDDDDYRMHWLCLKMLLSPRYIGTHWRSSKCYPSPQLDCSDVEGVGIGMGLTLTEKAQETLW